MAYNDHEIIYPKGTIMLLAKSYSEVAACAAIKVASLVVFNLFLLKAAKTCKDRLEQAVAEN